MAAAGDYAVELTTEGCAPKTALSAMIKLSGSIRAPVLTVTDPTLKTAVPHKAYSATVTVSGGRKRPGATPSWSR